MGMRTQYTLDLVRQRLDRLTDQRFDQGFSALEQSEYDVLTERELELLHEGSERNLSVA
jgi:hypothetical protein